MEILGHVSIKVSIFNRKQNVNPLSSHQKQPFAIACDDAKIPAHNPF